jgi:hypothetical protein
MPFAEGGPRSVLIVGGPSGSKFLSYDTANIYEEKAFGGVMHTVTLYNTHATDVLQWSWDGATLAGQLAAGASITVNCNNSSIWVKSTAGNVVVDFWYW